MDFLPDILIGLWVAASILAATYRMLRVISSDPEHRPHRGQAGAARRPARGPRPTVGREHRLARWVAPGSAVIAAVVILGVLLAG